MKVFIAIGAVFATVSCATAAPPTHVVPVEIVQGKIVHLWSVSVTRTLEGAKVAGLASRRLKPNGPVNEHLHAEAIGPDGKILKFNSVPWNSTVSLRTKKWASFQTAFGRESASLVRVKLSVVAGAIHRDGQ